MKVSRTIRFVLGAAAVVALSAVAGCKSAPGEPPAAVAPGGAPLAALSSADRHWVDSTLAAMTLPQKVAQMIFVRLDDGVDNPDAKHLVELREQIRDLEIGGLVIFRTPRDTIPVVLNELQRTSRLPLLVAADVERSVSMRVPEGSVDVPYQMAIGATRSTAAARFVGELTARECRALGIHWALAPVADVNDNPANPVINIRSFGEDSQMVAGMVRAWVEGARSGGVLSTAKHFPGHGDTAVNSHLALPVIGDDRQQLETVELPPFRAAIEAGVDTVMVGHLDVPALDPSGAPATLSKPIETGVLRGELGFHGLIVTDAMDMKGVGGLWMGGAAIRAVQAGADVVMLPPDPRVAIQSLEDAVAEGQLDEARIDASVRKILEAKARLGLQRNRFVDPLAARRAVGRPADQAHADEITAQSVTLVRNERGILPLHAEDALRVLHLVLASDWADTGQGGIPAGALAARGVAVTTRRLGPRISDAVADELVAAAPRYTQVVVSAYVRAAWNKASVAMDPSHARLVERLATSGVPLVVVSYDDPYILDQFPDAPVYVCTYGATAASQRAAIAALFAEHAVGGKLPVSIPGLASYGDGVALPRRDPVLEDATADPAAAGFRPGGLAQVGKVLDEFVAKHAFPGGVAAVGYRGKLVYLHPFGHQTYDPASPAVTADTLYDLASLTKVIATTTMAMMMVDEGRLNLDEKVHDFLPRFTGPEKDQVTVRELLTHSAGILWWAPLYESLHGKEEYLHAIEKLDLVTPPGTAEKYSDLGIILLGAILERVAGEPEDRFVREHVFSPLGMKDTMWKPPAALLPRIAPTENDTTWRHRVMHGEVHDENAYALGGVAPHAGLFSTAPDLARFAQMMLWKGDYDGQRIVARSTVETFTRKAGIVPGSDRAIGWDTKSATGSSAGTLFSPDSFGHTGFTGTSIWFDPDRQLFLVLLTNRVYPTRENQLIREARPAVADAVIRALADPDATPGRPAAVVQVGLDRVAAGEVPELAGKKLGLVVNAASVAADGRDAVEVFHDAQLDVVRLFSPEHGLYGAAGAGEVVASGVDPASGLPIVSLYGEHEKPTPQDLSGLDALVFDLQGAGVRFYTYSSTMLDCLQAAAEAGIPFVVLDRPDPLGGDRVEGPVSAPPDVVRKSFVNRAPGTLVHGMTLGEMARYANAKLAKPAALTVVPMTGWTRGMLWQDTGRCWVSASPNLRSADAALVYPGMALLEATNLSEGRGTVTPFLRFGAPWLDPAGIHLDLPGIRLVPTTFTPHASLAEPHPKYDGETCRGFRLEITDPHAVDPYRLGVTLLAELARQPGFAWRRNGEALSWLTGSPQLLLQIQAGTSREALLAADRATEERWRRERQDVLLYRSAEPDRNP